MNRAQLWSRGAAFQFELLPGLRAAMITSVVANAGQRMPLEGRTPELLGSCRSSSELHDLARCVARGKAALTAGAVRVDAAAPLGGQAAARVAWGMPVAVTVQVRVRT
jgi:hypothetical protein